MMQKKALLKRHKKRAGEALCIIILYPEMQELQVAVEEG
jgi:hypothetical protein